MGKSDCVGSQCAVWKYHDEYVGEYGNCNADGEIPV